MVSFGNIYSPVIKLYNMDLNYHALLDERQTGGNCNNVFSFFQYPQGHWRSFRLIKNICAGKYGINRK